MKQKIIYADYGEVKNWIEGKKVLLVCGRSFEHLKIKKCFTSGEVVRFSEFTSNPRYESVVEGVKSFNSNKCDAIVAIGGGSAIDVAKCIKLYSNMNDCQLYLDQEIVENTIPFMVMPTTAGTGSEATRFAVIYKDGEKISVTHDSCIPDTVFFDADALNGLPVYQKKATMLDAFCHAIESYWSINSTDESKAYSMEAITLILDNWKGYVEAYGKSETNMLKAANMAGKAINITQTTAGHAMCYKLTTMYGIAHGHAAALCVSKLWPYMINNHENIIDHRGPQYVMQMFKQLSKIMGCNDSMEAVEKFHSILLELQMTIPDVRQGDFDILISSVNADRLKNNPIKLNHKDIDYLYHEIMRG